MNIRHATRQDAIGIAHVHVKSWQTTYTGIMPDEIIQSRNIDNRTAIWTRILNSDNPNNILFVAEDAGQIVGFAQAGKPQESVEGFDSELYAIYLIEDAQGQGMGRQLMQACAKELHAKGYQSLLLWVLKDNRNSRSYYEHLGGKIVASGEYSPTETFTIKKLAYGWADIQTLMTGS